jgi:hypothetical protein
MEETLHFVERHGRSVIFAIVFLDQLGLPIPTIPILLALGALAGSGRIDPVSVSPSRSPRASAPTFSGFNSGAGRERVSSGRFVESRWSRTVA